MHGVQSAPSQPCGRLKRTRLHRFDKPRLTRVPQSRKPWRRADACLDRNREFRRSWESWPPRLGLLVRVELHPRLRVHTSTVACTTCTAASSRAPRPRTPRRRAAPRCTAPTRRSFREKYWGGIPISLFALGAFTFFAGFALYLADLRRARAATRRWASSPLVGARPVAGLRRDVHHQRDAARHASARPASASTSRRSCSAGSVLLAGLSAFAVPQGGGVADDGVRAEGSVARPDRVLVGAGAITLVPAAVYASAVPDHRPYLGKCGTLKREPTAGRRAPQDHRLAPGAARVVLRGPAVPDLPRVPPAARAPRACSTISTLRSSLFPLDSECNWMLDEPAAPGRVHRGQSRHLRRRSLAPGARVGLRRTGRDSRRPGRPGPARCAR